MKKFFSLLLLLTIFSSPLFAGKNKECPMNPIIPKSAEFQKMKDLAGTWKGTADHGNGNKEDVAVNYQLTSGGTAVLETLMPGTPHEMMSLYYEQDGKLRMTHYCMLGNRPVLELKKSTPETLTLELAKHSGIKKKETHMHALTLTFGKDKLTQAWTGYSNGKPTDTTVFTLTRSN